MISILIMVLGTEAEFPGVRSKAALMNARGQIDLICSSAYTDQGSVHLGIRSSVFRATYRHVQSLPAKASGFSGFGDKIGRKVAGFGHRRRDTKSDSQSHLF